ncbi:MAG: hypothetical protein AAF492_14735 [Verrucomicrobiota bacterium]
MPPLYIIQRHHELLELWRSRKDRNLNLLHVDFHDDLRGWLIERGKNRIFRLAEQPLDPGNFLGYAVMEGILARIRWVRGRHGGRAYDSGIVRYETDLAAQAYRLQQAFRKGPTWPLDFEEHIFEDWPGLSEPCRLDLDWDFFASYEYSPESIEKRLKAFLNKIVEMAPEEIYLCYSPEYVHPSRELFELAIEELKTRFGAQPEWPGGLFLDEIETARPEIPVPNLKSRLIRTLRKRNIF